MTEQRILPVNTEATGLPSTHEYYPLSDTLAIAATVGVVIPVLNEAANIPHVLRALPSWISEVVLVDGNSIDNTVTVAKEQYPSIKVIVQDGRGKGDALLAGFAACCSDIIVTVDGDGSTDGSEIIRFVSALASGADFVKGSRFVSGGGSDDITLMRRLGNRVLSSIVNHMFSTRYTDLCYGYNAFWARHLSALAIDCTGFEVETVMNIRAAKRGLWVQEVPSHERCRLHGVSHLRILRDGYRIIKVIFRERFMLSAPPVQGKGLQWQDDNT